MTTFFRFRDNCSLNLKSTDNFSQILCSHDNFFKNSQVTWQLPGRAGGQHPQTQIQQSPPHPQEDRGQEESGWVSEHKGGASWELLLSFLHDLITLGLKKNLYRFFSVEASTPCLLVSQFKIKKYIGKVFFWSRENYLCTVTELKRFKNITRSEGLLYFNKCKTSVKVLEFFRRTFFFVIKDDFFSWHRSFKAALPHPF